MMPGAPWVTLQSAELPPLLCGRAALFIHSCHRTLLPEAYGLSPSAFGRGRICADWLRLQVQDPIQQPLAFWFCLLRQNLPAVRSSVLRRTSGTKCRSGSGARFPEDPASVSDNPEPKLFIF
jgi:hypothetical protein